MAWLARPAAGSHASSTVVTVKQKTGSLVSMDAVELVVLAGNQYRQQEHLLVPQEKEDWNKGSVGWAGFV